MAYQPRFFGRIIRLLIRCGFGHGQLKNFWSWLWRKTCGEDLVDITYYNGAKFRIQPFGNTIENRMFFGSRTREEKELACIRAALKDGGVVLDIGANIGYYSISSALLGSQLVIAVEPNPQVYERLETNIALNALKNRIKLIKKGLGDGTADKATLAIDANDLGSSSMVANVSGTEVIEVELLSLAKLVEEFELTAIDVLKIDIEGMEDRVLVPFFEQMPEKLYPKLIVLEENPEHWQKDLLGALATAGYKMKIKTRGNTVFERAL